MRVPKLALDVILLQAMLSLLFISAFFSHSVVDVESSFDVRQHLSTVTRYGAVKDMLDDNFVPSSVPNGCTPIHLNLVARHGMRSPTKKRMRELDKLANSLQVLIEHAKEQKFPLEKVPEWLFDWKSPWSGKVNGGELIIKGEEELYALGIRTRERFPEIFHDDYHPDIYSIRATQHYRESQEPAVEKLKDHIFDEIRDSLCERYGLNFSRQHVSSLWFLCKQEASLLDITDQACGLFSPFEINLLEWTDDIEVFVLKGYGNSLNYRMGVPLLKDVLESMELGIIAYQEGLPRGSFEKARLRFAHAETVVPFSCLLGLFLDGAEFEKIQHEQPLELPPKPLQKRRWKGSIVAPFSGNNMLVVYSCPANSSSNYYVRVLHNEHPIPMPGCDNSDFCPFEVFKERIVRPHLKHEFNDVCDAKKVQPEPKHPGRLSLLFGWLFSRGNDEAESHKVEL
ncbi:hypothetical protein Dimus_005853 [Dionaea muscipula]